MNRIAAMLLPILCMAMSVSVLAEDPPQPTQDLSVITVSKEVTGTGKRSDPFVFDQTTKCVLKLTGKADGVTWDKDDVPPDFDDITPSICVFSLQNPGEYTTCAHGGAVYSKVWFVIRATGPPAPTPPVNTLSAKLKTILIGPDAKADAAKLSGMSGATADALEAKQINTMGELNAAWKATQTANKWPPGKYTGMPELIRLVVPVADETNGPIPIDDAGRAAFVTSFRTIEKTARDISNG